MGAPVHFRHGGIAVIAEATSLDLRFHGGRSIGKVLDEVVQVDVGGHVGDLRLFQGVFLLPRPTKSGFPVFDCFVKGLIYLTLQGSQRLTLYYTQVGERVSVILGVGEVSRLGCLIVR